uniref:Putative reverse transcriptase domain-containing protein n=1 Tax=Tanacetum cinerariifolium TaxID=118510 RepID=A0A6L2JSD9_TANCI|nr:putative reverse transcriptase domain-containing protein [Tanacetum cinerariifolium]
MESLNSNFQERELHQLQQMQDKAKESCMVSFRLLHLHLKALSNNDLKGTCIEGGFKRAFATLFDQDFQSFTGSMFLNLDQLENQLDKEEYQEIGSFDAFRVLMTQFQTFINFRYYFDNDEALMIRKYFIAYTKIDVLLFHATLIQHMKSLRESILKRAKHKQEKDRRVNNRMMQSKKRKDNSSKAFDVGLVVTEINETESERNVLSSRSENDTHTGDADINSVNDKQPMAEVQVFAEHNTLANEQQHSEQSAFVYDTYLLEKVDRNTTPESTDMSHRGREIDQNADVKKCQVSCPLLDPSFDNMTTKFLNQFLKYENISLKKTIAQLQKDFSRMETHCVNMKLKYQNQVLKNGQHGQILNERSNESNIKREINVLENRNIDLERSVARLLAENEKLNKKNVHLKQTYKDLSNSIKKTSVQTKDHADSFIVQLNFTPHYLPKVRESAPAKPHHVNAPSSSRNSKKESYGSNDMAHNYYLKEAKKKTPDQKRNLKPREIPSAKTHHTLNACTPKPKSNNQTSRNWPASKSLNFRAKIQPNKTRNSNKPVDPTSHTQKPGRKIVIGHSFSPNKSSVVHEKTNTPRSYLRERSDWQPLERKKVNEELGKVHWWEIVRRRPTAVTKDYMISSYDVLIIQPLKVGKTLFQNSQRFTHFYRLSHSELVGIEKVALSSILRSLNQKIHTLAGNPVKEILLKLNLPDNRILKDGGEVIVCDEKLVCIPYGSETLTIQGDRSESRLNIISCIKTQKYLKKGCHMFLSYIKEKKLEEKRLEDVPVVHDFSKVFLEDLSRLPPTRQVEFQIDLVSGAALVAQSSYRLDLLEMQKLSSQLQELAYKGFIRPTSSPWGAPILFLSKRMDLLECALTTVS